LITRSKHADPRVEQIARGLFVFSRNPDFLSYGWHREAPYFKKTVKKSKKHPKPKKKTASPVKPAPVARPVPKEKVEMRRWAVGRPQEATGAFVRIFINPKKKKLVELRAPDGKLYRIGFRSLIPEDLAYLKSIQAETK